MSDRPVEGALSPFEIRVRTRWAVLATVSLVLIALIFLFVETYNMMPPVLPGYPGDAFFPRLVLGYCLVWAVIIVARAVFLRQAAAAARREVPYIELHWLEFASVIALVLIYAVLLEPVGFEITTVALMMVLLIPRLLAGRHATLPRAVLQAFALSVATMLILYAGLGPALKIGLPLMFLPIYFQ
jgi:hypothetical protein